MTPSNFRFEACLSEGIQDKNLSSLLVAILKDARQGLSEFSGYEKFIHIFWLCGPFILLIERSPADLWLSVLSVAFVARVITQKDLSFLSAFWVRATFLFWIWCLFTAILSSDPAYSFGEAFVWLRFPLFAMATCFWLARDRRLLYAMLLSTAIGLFIMCCILFAEVMIEGQKSGRLTWPYGDLVPGNYVTKVGLPIFTILVALAVSIKSRLGALSGLFAFITLVISLMTGERINFLIGACCGMLAGLVWKPKWSLYLGLLIVEVLAVLALFSALPVTAARYTEKLVKGISDIEHSGMLQVLNGGLEVAKNNLIIGIGPGNYRHLSHEMLVNVMFVIPDNHPHNYYIQLIAETGILGLLLGILFMGSMIWACLKASFSARENVFFATAWVIPFGLFWPIATSGDFFGQWNNIFMWSSIALAMTSTTEGRKAA